MIQREHERIPFEAPIRLALAGQIIEWVKCVNISMGGICLELSSSIGNFNSGIVALEKQIDNATVRFEADAEVMWRKPGESDASVLVGLRFGELNPQNRRSLVQMIVHRLREIDARKSAT